jgi:PPOX class probable F420-dependent enzyme
MSTPQGTADPRFGAADVPPAPWSDVEQVLRTQQMACLSTVRADGRPHVTPLVFAWVPGSSGRWPGRLFVHTGEGEQKTVNLDANPAVVLAVAQPGWEAGLDVVVEGNARRAGDLDDVRLFAAALAQKYPEWAYQVDDVGLVDPESERRPVVLEVVVAKVLAFGRGDRTAQTRFVVD